MSVEDIENVKGDDSPSKVKESVSKKAKGKKESSGKAVTQVAEECLAGNRKWNTGRDRDELLKAAGYDPDEVRQEVYRIRGERLTNA